MFDLLVVTAVAAEADALLARLGPSIATAPGPVPIRRADTALGTVDVIVGGVGVANAAATTAVVLARSAYDLVVSAGIAGGFSDVGLGTIVVADVVVQADLGAQDGASFLSVSELGFGQERTELAAATTAELARRCGGRVGGVLTVSTVTGTTQTAAQRLQRHPGALAEAMEGAGVLAAAQVLGAPFAEIRAISNAVGPRDRSTWQIGPALTALGRAVLDITASSWPS